MPLVNKSRIAVVTGGSSGIGLAAAMELASQGFEVIVVARNSTKLDEAAQKIRQSTLYGAKVTILVADITDKNIFREKWNNLVLERGQKNLETMVSALIMCAGQLEFDYPGNDSLKQMMGINFEGTVNTFQVLRHWLEHDARICVVSSVCALARFPGNFESYAISKSAVAAYGANLREELRVEIPTKQSVTIAYPSIVATPMIQGKKLPKVYKCFKHHAPEEAARAIVRDTLERRETSFICTSDRALAKLAQIAPRTFAKAIKWWVEKKK